MKLKRLLNLAIILGVSAACATSGWERAEAQVGTRKRVLDRQSSITLKEIYGINGATQARKAAAEIGDTCSLRIDLANSVASCLPLARDKKFGFKLCQLQISGGNNGLPSCAEVKTLRHVNVLVDANGSDKIEKVTVGGFKKKLKLLERGKVNTKDGGTDTSTEAITVTANKDGLIETSDIKLDVKLDKPAKEKESTNWLSEACADTATDCSEFVFPAPQKPLGSSRCAGAYCERQADGGVEATQFCTVSTTKVFKQLPLKLASVARGKLIAPNALNVRGNSLNLKACPPSPQPTGEDPKPSCSEKTERLEGGKCVKKEADTVGRCKNPTDAATLFDCKDANTYVEKHNACKNANTEVSGSQECRSVKEDPSFWQRLKNVAASIPGKVQDKVEDWREDPRGQGADAAEGLLKGGSIRNVAIGAGVGFVTGGPVGGLVGGVTALLIDEFKGWLSELFGAKKADNQTQTSQPVQSSTPSASASQPTDPRQCSELQYTDANGDCFGG